MCSIGEAHSGSKRCPACGETKPLEAFCRNKRSPDGRAFYCRPCHNAKGKESVARNGGARRYHLRGRYGIEPAEVQVIIEAQGGLCAICRRQPAVQVDHDHASGVVRGILCDGCNGTLSAFRESPMLLTKAIEYLDRWN